MNEISVIKTQLPDNIEDLAKFTFYGRERIVALNAAIRACSRQDILLSKMEEMKSEVNGLSETVLVGEAKMGELLQEIPKASGGDVSKKFSGEPFVTPKQQATADLGISVNQAKRYQTLAKHPDLVEEAIAEARENHRAVTRADVMKKIAPPERESKTREYWKAKEAHQEYQKEKESGVLNFENAKADKQNIKIIANNFSEELGTALFKIEKIGAWKSEELNSVLKSLNQETKLELAKRISKVTKILCYIGEELIGEKK